MKKRVAFYSVYLLIVFLALGFLYYNNEVTGNFYKITSPSYGYWGDKVCVETDRGYDWYFTGETYYEGYSERYKDECLKKTLLIEYYCQDGKIRSWLQNCPIGYTCLEGKCIEDNQWYRWNYAYRSRQGIEIET